MNNTNTTAVRIRVVWYFKSSAPGLYGWDNSVRSFDSYEAAKSAFDDASLRPTRWTSIDMDRLEDGRWNRLDRIKRPKV